VKLARAIGRAAGSVTLLARRIVADQKRIWEFPVTATRDSAWKPALGVLGATAALIALDPIDTPCIQQAGYQETPAIRCINRVLSAGNMARVIWTVPLAFYFGGFLLRNSYAWRTGLLALEAAGDAQVIAITMKHIDRRMRPIEVGCDGDFTHTWFGTRTFKLDGAGCFPSGHTASAFAVATVFAERYPKSVRVAYGAAGLIAASRISTRAHFPSDVFFGAALGYSISHFVVMERVATPDGHVTAGG
jgi:membrane-associated phospholipid phosphatase